MKQLRYKGQYYIKPLKDFNPSGIVFMAIVVLTGAILDYNSETSVYFPKPKLLDPGYVVAAETAPALDRTTQESPKPSQKPVESIVEPQTEVERIIYQYFPENYEEARKVAFCESSLRPDAAHEHSSAKGIYQILRGTWKWLKCSGDPLNAEDNIKCARKLYDKYG